MHFQTYLCTMGIKGSQKQVMKIISTKNKQFFFVKIFVKNVQLCNMLGLNSGTISYSNHFVYLITRYSTNWPFFLVN